MIRAEAIIVNSRGLHARPSSQLAKLAASFQSEIVVKNGRKQADATSITSLLMLVAPKNTELAITAKGKDEKKAIAAVLELIAGGFGDGVDSPAVAENPPAIETPSTQTMIKIDGIGVAAGAIVGKAQVRLVGDSEAPRYNIPKSRIAAEQKRFSRALEHAQNELTILFNKIACMDGAAEMTPFIELHKTLLQDAAMLQKIRDTIDEQQCNAEWAVKQRADAVSAQFLNIEDSYMRERGADVRHVMRRLLAAMKPRTGRQIEDGNAAGMIVVAADLDPAQVILLRRRGYAGFATESGGNASHTAILARSICMPAIVGAKGLLTTVQNGDDLILDMDNGAVILHPDAQTVAECKNVATSPLPTRKAKKLRGVKTEDGETIFLQVNMELPDEVNSAISMQADGIGLFRTEFLFLNRPKPPEEDEQFEIYRRVLQDMAPLPVVVRTLDLGADKINDDVMNDSNPLGMRAIRYCLAHPKLFLTQLRALLRAAAECRNLRILLPMLSHPAELEQSVALINNAREQLRAVRGISVASPPLGGMIEVPAAVFIMRDLAQHLDFFSIGTNDLTQYTLAADRSDERLARYYQHPHPAIIQLLAAIVDNAARTGKPVTICGEMAGNPEMMRLLLSLGLRRLSMSVPQITALRDMIPTLNCSRLAANRRKLLAAESPEKLLQQIQRLNAASPSKNTTTSKQ